jgi:hypothetical protein
MEGIKVKEKGQFPGRWAYAIPILVIILGLMVSAWILIGAGFWNYPATIEKAFGEEQHHLKVPGSKDVTLTRSGAYGIYYEYNLEACQGEKSQTPPAIECSLTSKSTGAVTQAVPEYVETNRYEAKDQGRKRHPAFLGCGDRNVWIGSFRLIDCHCRCCKTEHSSEASDRLNLSV